MCIFHIVQYKGKSMNNWKQCYGCLWLDLVETILCTVSKSLSSLETIRNNLQTISKNYNTMNT